MVWPYHVHVVGAGIAGLSFAVALAQKAKANGLQGLTPENFRIDEWAPTPMQEGAGIQLAPNVVRLLENQLGLSTALGKLGFAPRRISLYSMTSGRRLSFLPLHDFEERYGAKYVTIHRAGLQSALLEKLEEAGQTVNWASQFGKGLKEALSCTPNPSHEETLRKAIGEDQFKDEKTLLVGADGLRSICRKIFFETTNTPGGSEARIGLTSPFFTGQLALRCLVPSLEAIPLEQQQEVAVWTAPEHHLVGYPIVMPDDPGTCLYYSLVGFIKTSSVEASPQHKGWTSLANEMQIQSLFAELHPSLQWLRQGAHSWSSWPLWASPVMASAENHYKKNVFLLGDAAHAMRPHQAQGSAMAIEDACALAHHLTHGSGTLHERCQSAANNRWRRNARVQQQSERNGKIFQLRGPLAWFRDRALGIAGARLMDQPWLFEGPPSSY
jgi:salicylate hydroxylase